MPKQNDPLDDAASAVEPNTNTPAEHAPKPSTDADLSSLEDLKGKTIRVRAEHCGVRAIGHIVNDDWFCPADDFANVGAKKGGAS